MCSPLSYPIWASEKLHEVGVTSPTFIRRKQRDFPNRLSNLSQRIRRDPDTQASCLWSSHPLMLSLPARTQDPHTGKAQTQPPPQQPFHFKQFLELARLVPVLRPVPSLFPQPGMLFLYMDLHAIGSFLSFRCQLKCHLLRKAFLVHPTKNNLPVSLYCITVLFSSQQLLSWWFLV